MKRNRVLVWFVVATSVALAACGSDGEAENGTVNRLPYRQPDSGEAEFDVSGTSDDGNDFAGAIVISGPT